MRCNNSQCSTEKPRTKVTTKAFIKKIKDQKHDRMDEVQEVLRTMIIMIIINYIQKSEALKSNKLRNKQ